MTRMIRFLSFLGAFALVLALLQGCSALGLGFHAGVNPPDPNGPVVPAIPPDGGFDALLFAVGFGVARILEIGLRMGIPLAINFVKAKVAPKE